MDMTTVFSSPFQCFIMYKHAGVCGSKYNILLVQKRGKFNENDRQMLTNKTNRLIIIQTTGARGVCIVNIKR